MGELRIRNVSKELSDKFKKIEKHFNVTVATDAIEMLINEFFEDKKELINNQKTIRDREDVIYRYQLQENNFKDLVQKFVRITKDQKLSADQFIKAGSNLIKKLSTKPKAKKKGGKK